MTRKLFLAALIAPIALAGCMSTTTSNGVPLIAQDRDSSFGDGLGPRDGKAAVAVTPDGCQAWIVDEGVEGYASTRSDPRSGLPVCDNRIPRGAVVGDHRASDDLFDILP
ncbi:hypothetical protein [Sinisalibacter aestuarii]|uniref:Lipoprotein n=1 Tax=Sinisalibacter aestuarii TaxID=2949426 RepID=A0ABQ5LXT7_9RHOB|nr:hypothetical protein [Sinisalibacter aestuarii]GKY88912.1 hypothetical protein STA1M1_27810 [Sinisalibacter aestuarii]